MNLDTVKREDILILDPEEQNKDKDFGEKDYKHSDRCCLGQRFTRCL